MARAQEINVLSRGLRGLGDVDPQLLARCIAGNVMNPAMCPAGSTPPRLNRSIKGHRKILLEDFCAEYTAAFGPPRRSSAPTTTWLTMGDPLIPCDLSFLVALAPRYLVDAKGAPDELPAQLGWAIPEIAQARYRKAAEDAKAQTDAAKAYAVWQEKARIAVQAQADAAAVQDQARIKAAQDQAAAIAKAAADAIARAQDRARSKAAQDQPPQDQPPHVAPPSEGLSLTSPVVLGAAAVVLLLLLRR